MEARTGKLAITAAIVGLIVATTIAMETEHRAPALPPAVVTPPDKANAEKISAELRRCNQLGPNDKPDQACLDTWAEVRRQFMGGRR